MVKFKQAGRVKFLQVHQGEVKVLVLASTVFADDDELAKLALCGFKV